MLGVTHILIGTATGYGAAYAAGLPVEGRVAVAAGAALGSLLPDADEAGALIHKSPRFKRGSELVVFGNPVAVLAMTAVLELMRAVALLVLWVARLPLKALALLPHRGPVTHGPFVAVPLIVLLTVLGVRFLGPLQDLLLWGVLVGFLAHLAADGMTPHGLPGWPLVKKIHLLPRGLRIRTGSTTERVLVPLVIAGACGLLFLGCGGEPERVACSERDAAAWASQNAPSADPRIPAGSEVRLAPGSEWPRLAHIEVEGVNSANVRVACSGGSYSFTGTVSVYL